jgi:hypothetical protein
MRAIVLLDRYGVSCGTAELVEQVFAKPDLSVLGGIVLNREVGFVNPEAVETAVRYGKGASFVSLPTHDTASVAMRQGDPLRTVKRAYSVGSELTDDLARVLELCVQHELVFNSGHVGAKDSIVALRYARERGVEKLIAPVESHMFDATALRTLSELGAFIELAFYYMHGAPNVPNDADKEITTIAGRFTARKFADTVKEIGAGGCIMSTDAGSEMLPRPVEAMKALVRSMLDLGISENEIRMMISENPRKLYGRWLA